MTGLLAIDTSVSVAMLWQPHPQHEDVWTYVSDRELALPAHALAETYSVLTRLPGDACFSPEDAALVIHDNFATILSLPSHIVSQTHQLMAAKGVKGGQSYDGLVALAAKHHDVPLATRDTRALPVYAALGVRVEVI